MVFMQLIQNISSLFHNFLDVAKISYQLRRAENSTQYRIRTIFSLAQELFLNRTLDKAKIEKDFELLSKIANNSSATGNDVYFVNGWKRFTPYEHYLWCHRLQTAYPSYKEVAFKAKLIYQEIDTMEQKAIITCELPAATNKPSQLPSDKPVRSIQLHGYEKEDTPYNRNPNLIAKHIPLLMPEIKNKIHEKIWQQNQILNTSNDPEFVKNFLEKNPTDSTVVSAFWEVMNQFS
jgi:hypothetical protein